MQQEGKAACTVQTYSLTGVLPFSGAGALPCTETFQLMQVSDTHGGASVKQVLGSPAYLTLLRLAQS